MSSIIRRVGIPLYEQQMDNVAEAIRNGELVLGRHLELLRERLAQLFGKRYVALTANGFSALFVALKAALAQPRSILTAPASTCHAMTNAIRAAGHQPIFADMEVLAASLPAAGDNAPDTVAIIPDHFGLLAEANRNRAPGSRLLIEDASQSFISCSRERGPADAIVLSFYPTKLVNGIDGGALLTDDADLYERARRLICYSDQHRYESDGRYNFRMNNVNAALALGTLDHLSEIAARLQSLYAVLSDAFRRKGTRHLMARGQEVASRFIVVAEDEADKEAWLRHFELAGIQAASELEFICPPERVPSFPVAGQLVRTSFSVPFHPLLSDAELERMRAAIGAR